MMDKCTQSECAQQRNCALKTSEIQEMTTRVNKILINYPLRLITVGQSEKMMIKMIHTANSQVISEFPPKKIKDLIDIIWQVAGLTVN